MSTYQIVGVGTAAAIWDTVEAASPEKALVLARHRAQNRAVERYTEYLEVARAMKFWDKCVADGSVRVVEVAPT